MKRTKQAADRVLLEFSLPLALAREYLDLMQLAHMMGNLSAVSPRDKVDMVLAAAIIEALKRQKAPTSGKATSS
jgi:hypothetical protein